MTLGTSPQPPPRPRGAPFGNSNARKHGVFSARDPHPISALLRHLEELNRLQRTGTASPREMLSSARAIRRRLETVSGKLANAQDPLWLPAFNVFLGVQAVIGRLIASQGASTIPHTRLLKIARSPLSLIRSSFERRGITRDADSFKPASSPTSPLSSFLFPFSGSELIFSVPEKTTQNSPALCSVGLASPAPRSAGRAHRPAKCRRSSGSVLPGCPPGSTPSSIHDLFSLVPEKDAPNPFLTDEQWAVLEPLLPLDPEPEYQDGDPPALIALNRWGFTEEIPGELSSFIAIQEYRRIMDSCRPDGPPQSHAQQGLPHCPAKYWRSPRKSC